MLMKWSDLEPGDVVKIREEIIKYSMIRFPDWTRKFCFKEIEIKTISIYYINIYIGFMIDGIYRELKINQNGKEEWTGRNLVLFDVVKLKDD